MPFGWCRAERFLYLDGTNLCIYNERRFGPETFVCYEADVGMLGILAEVSTLEKAMEACESTLSMHQRAVLEMGRMSE